jgi:hypothetical protein
MIGHERELEAALLRQDRIPDEVEGRVLLAR